MTVNAEWVQRNLGLETQNLTPRADELPVAEGDQSIQRELIDYDSQGASGAAFASTGALGRAGIVALRAHPMAEEPGTKGRLRANW